MLAIRPDHSLVFWIFSYSSLSLLVSIISAHVLFSPFQVENSQNFQQWFQSFFPFCL